MNGSPEGEPMGIREPLRELINGEAGMSNDKEIEFRLIPIISARF
jgi:hypothetical protein